MISRLWIKVCFWQARRESWPLSAKYIRFPKNFTSCSR